MSRAPQHPGMKPETVAVKCCCGKRHVLDDIQHYDRILAPCGALLFAIRRNDGGPLELIKHPGPNLTKEEYRLKYGSDE